MFCAIRAIPTFGTSDVLPVKAGRKPTDGETFSATRRGASPDDSGYHRRAEAGDQRRLPGVDRSPRPADLACCVRIALPSLTRMVIGWPAAARAGPVPPGKFWDRLETEPVRLPLNDTDDPSRANQSSDQYGWDKLGRLAP